MSLERANQVRSDPAAIKFARLRHCFFSLYETDIHKTWIEGELASSRNRRGCRGFVTPGGSFCLFARSNDSAVCGCAFPFAKAQTGLGVNEFRTDVVSRDLVDRRVTGFENANRVSPFNNYFASKLNAGRL